MFEYKKKKKKKKKTICEIWLYEHTNKGLD